MGREQTRRAAAMTHVLVRHGAIRPRAAAFADVVDQLVAERSLASTLMNLLDAEPDPAETTFIRSAIHITRGGSDD